MPKNINISRPGAIILLLITAALWSTGGFLIKLVDWHPLAIASMRSAIAAVILFIYIKKPVLTWSKAQIGAALAYAATSILFILANKLTTAANTILLQFTAPIYVALFSWWLLKEKLKLLDWLTVCLVFGGMTLFFFDNLSISGKWGNLIAVLCGVSFAFFTIFMRLQKDGSPLESILLGNILAALLGLPWLFTPGPGTAGWLGLLLLGVVQLGIPYILYSIAIKQIMAIEAILTLVIEPILNPLWVFILIGEVPGPWALVGGLVVLSVITLRYILTELQAKKARQTAIAK